MTDSQEAPETIIAEGPSIECDGGGALGHPRVFLTFDHGGWIDCPYCGLKFQQQPGSPGGN